MFKQRSDVVISVSLYATDGRSVILTRNSSTGLGGLAPGFYPGDGGRDGRFAGINPN